MGIKERWQRRIEKNAVISDISWTDRRGKRHEEHVIIKRSQMPLVGDWARIYPPIDEDGKINWINLIFGGKQNFFRLLIVMIILFLLFQWVIGILGANKEYMDGSRYVIVEKPLFEKYCTMTADEGMYVENTKTNLTIFKIKEEEG